jgi:hypothetical protein
MLASHEDLCSMELVTVEERASIGMDMMQNSTDKSSRQKSLVSVSCLSMEVMLL